MKILKYPNRCLTTPANDSVDFLSDRQSFIRDLSMMINTLMCTPSGIALAANQVGLPHRLFIIDRKFAEKNNVPSTIICPRIVSSSGKVKMDEGCLSFPGVSLRIERPEVINVRFMDESQNWYERELSGMVARVFLHESEHLDGKLFIDNVDRIAKYQAIGKMRR